MDITCEGIHGSSEAQHNLDNFWSRALEDVKSLKMHDFRAQELPLARIKKIMKLDEDVKMISAEAPALFAKAAEFFISELTLRAWILAEENKRRTLQRNDIATAISKYDQFDFLIDIVPREEVRPSKHSDDGGNTGVSSDQVQYFFQVTPQQQQASGQIIQSPIQILTGSTAAALTQTGGDTSSGAQVIQIQAPAAANLASVVQPTATGSQPAAASAPVALAASGQTMQVYTQVVTPSGEIQQIPIQLTPQQIQAIHAQMQGKQPNQPIVIQTTVDSSGGTDGSTQFVQQL